MSPMEIVLLAATAAGVWFLSLALRPDPEPPRVRVLESRVAQERLRRQMGLPPRPARR